MGSRMSQLPALWPPGVGPVIREQSPVNIVLPALWDLSYCQTLFGVQFHLADFLPVFFPHIRDVNRSMAPGGFPGTRAVPQNKHFVMIKQMGGRKAP